MVIDVKVPTPGESIAEVEVAVWHVATGDLVRKNQELADIESDKATLSLTAPESGRIEILVEAGTTVKVNSIACRIDGSVAVPEQSPAPDTELAAANTNVEATATENVKPSSEPVKTAEASKKMYPEVKATPLAREKMEAENIQIDELLAGLRKLTSKDVDAYLEWKKSGVNGDVADSKREVNRSRMSQLRKQLSKRLVQVKNETAMLTTFNEVDMSSLMDLRRKYQDEFVKKYGFKIGLISFFLKAAANALKLHPMVNSMIDGDEILSPGYVDISVAVQSPKGLMVPVMRNVDKLSLPQIESQLQIMAEKARAGKISLEEMTGGSFTLTNGGVFGSMLSTPLINPPQSAIIGMHNITDRPVAINGKVEIRPMMYVALSYDHRLIDGKDSVGFLLDIKRMIENPASLLSGGINPDKLLLGL